jgi:hypothetical protein
MIPARQSGAAMKDAHARGVPPLRQRATGYRCPGAAAPFAIALIESRFTTAAMVIKTSGNHLQGTRSALRDTQKTFPPATAPTKKIAPDAFFLPQHPVGSLFVTPARDTTAPSSDTPQGAFRSVIGLIERCRRGIRATVFEPSGRS